MCNKNFQMVQIECIYMFIIIYLTLTFSLHVPVVSLMSTMPYLFGKTLLMCILVVTSEI